MEDFKKAAIAIKRLGKSIKKLGNSITEYDEKQRYYEWFEKEETVYP